MEKASKIFVAGHNGLVGSALVKNLIQKGYTNIVTRTRQELDLTNTSDVNTFFAAEKPDYVFLAAAKVGGIIANNTYHTVTEELLLAALSNVLANTFGYKDIYIRDCLK